MWSYGEKVWPRRIGCPKTELDAIGRLRRSSMSSAIVAEIEEIGSMALKVVPPEFAFGNDEPHKGLLDQPVSPHCIVDELPKAGVCKCRAISLHHLESAQ
jgi:hypothetical protein